MIFILWPVTTVRQSTATGLSAILLATYLATNLVHSSMYLRPTSPFEILCANKQLNPYKSCGLDGIDAKFVQLGAEVIAPALCLLFNTCFENGFLSTCLKEAKVVPVFKSGDRRKLPN